jgi:outer membrane protein OmpU
VHLDYEHEGKTMKKVLFATTALVATAGVAAADVSLSGSAEMGLNGGTGQDAEFFQDIEVTFSMSGQTDNGLTFGASIQLDEAAWSATGDDGGTSVFVSGDFGTLTMGDTDGALDWALTEAAVGNAGSIQDNETGHAGYLGSYGDGMYDGQILRYDYSVGDFGVAVSFEMDDTGVLDAGFAVGGRYSAAFAGGSVDLGIGYQTGQINDNYLPGNLSAATLGYSNSAVLDVAIVGVSAAVELDNGLSAGVQYSRWNVDHVLLGIEAAEIDHVGLGLGYTFDAVTVSANWGQFDAETMVGNGTISGYGLAAAYDFGGGLSAHVAYGSSDYGSLGADSDSWSLGLAMSF